MARFRRRRFRRSFRRRGYGFRSRRRRRSRRLRKIGYRM